MTMSRKDIRTGLAAILAGMLTGIDPAHIYPYQVGDFAGVSPVVFLTSSGSGREHLTFQGGLLRAYVNVHILVLYAERDGWTEQQAEDLLDSLESQVGHLTEDGDKTRGAGWEAVEYDDRSNADGTLEIGGDEYLHEIIPLVVTVLK